MGRGRQTEGGEKMIRRDYLMRMIEEAVAALRRSQKLRGEEKWDEAGGELDEEFKKLVGAGPQAVAQLSETELLAKMLAGEATLYVRDKTFLLTALLKEAGDLAVAQEHFEAGRACYLKGLHLLLNVLAREAPEGIPEFVPRVEMFVSALEETPLPLRTQAALMQHYEFTGQFGRAEDCLFAMLEEQEDSAMLDFGVAFFERMKHQTDEALMGGNLPRAEVASGLAELRSKKSGTPS